MVTSGIDGIYPKGFVIGTVALVERGSGLYKTIQVEPAVEFADLEDVLVIVREPTPVGTSAGGGGGRPRAGWRWRSRWRRRRRWCPG